MLSRKKCSSEWSFSMSYFIPFKWSKQKIYHPYICFDHWEKRSKRQFYDGFNNHIFQMGVPFLGHPVARNLFRAYFEHSNEKRKTMKTIATANHPFFYPRYFLIQQYIQQLTLPKSSEARWASVSESHSSRSSQVLERKNQCEWKISIHLPEHMRVYKNSFTVRGYHPRG